MSDKYIVLPIKKYGICDYKPGCFMSSSLILYYTIINIFINNSDNKDKLVTNSWFPKKNNNNIYLCKGSLQDH